MSDTSDYQTTVQRKAGKIGELHLQRNGIALPPLSTPILFPVLSLMTSTSTNGGGIWKYLLKDVMKYNVPILSQVLHFLDFNLRGKHIGDWREKPMRERYREPNDPYDAPMFLDSGGFKLLYNAGLSLSEFGIHKETEADNILDFQLDLGGDIIASLDYPLPPSLVRAEAETRMDRSLQNAFRVAKRLAEMENPPYLYICCHGQSREDIQSYVTQVFERLPGRLPFGLAVGLLVPLRGNNDSEVLSRICGVLEAIPDSARDRIPIHAFGVSGNLTPILAYMGVDSFDSTSYIQAARSLSYSHLTIPYAGKKPYSLSRTHSIVKTKLHTAFGKGQRFIHKITLSGLYGPVPEEFESEEAVVGYDFQLLPRNAAQIQLGADQFSAYLDRHKAHNELIVGYATSRAYRKVLELVGKHHPDFILLPTKPKQTRLSEFFRHIHLDELIKILSSVLTKKSK